MEDLRFNVDEALFYIKNHKIVFTVFDNKKVFFKYSDHNIRVNNGNAFYFIDQDDFLKTYQECIFFLATCEGFEVSKEKDEEYYNYKHK